MADVAQILNKPLTNPVVPAPKVAPKKAAAPAPAAGPDFNSLIDIAKQKATNTEAATVSEAGAEADAAKAKAALEQAQSSDIRGAYAREQSALDKIDNANLPFKPTQDTVKDMIPLFAMVGMLAASLGGKGTSMAGTNAQAALTGMIKGWNAGRQDVVVEQKQAYDENIQYLKDSAQRVKDAFAEYKDNVINYGGGSGQAEKLQQDLTLAEGAVLAKKTQLAGATAAEKAADDMIKFADQVQVQEDRAFNQKLQVQRLGMEQERLGMEEKAQQTGDIDDGTANFLAQEFLLTKQMPALGMGSSKIRTKILVKAAQIARDAGISGYDAATISAGFLSDKASLTIITKQHDVAKANENALLANMKVAQGLEPEAQKSAIPYLNKWLQTGSTAVGGAGVPAYATAIVTVADKYAKILSGSIGSAPASDASRAQAFNIISQSLNQGQIDKVFDVIRKDSDNTIKGYADQVDETKRGMKNLVPGAEKSVTGPKDGQTGTSKSGKPVIYRNGQWEYP